jgi:predicted nucleotidyltransferase
MDKAEVINIAKEFASAVAERYDCVSIILFGSYAKGLFHLDSDIDIAVVLKDYDNLISIQLDLMKLRRNIDLRIEPHPIRERDYNNDNPLVNEIKKYGKVINVA